MPPAAERLIALRQAIRRLRFTVVGACVADCFVTAPRLPEWGDGYEARAIGVSPGGKALNQAVALARLGARVAAVGAVGGDGLGRDILAALVREGIDAEGVRIRDGRPTPVCICFVGDDGRTAFVWHLDAAMAVTPDELRAAGLDVRPADAVLVTFELPAATIREAMLAARRGGARLFVQPAPPLADPGAAARLPWDRADVVVPNEAEARALLGTGGGGRELPAEGLAAALASRLCVPTVVVTLGEAGCVVHSNGATRRYPAHRTVVVDATGASDALTATLAAYLTAGAREGEAIQAAQAAAASAIGRRRGHESMPRADE